VELLSVADARRLILEQVRPLAPIDLPLAECYGCVAARDVAADYDVPPFSSAAGAGVAARSADIHGASAESPVVLRVAGRVVSGRPPDVVVGWGECARIDDGAPMPAGTDCVIPAGRFQVDGQGVRVSDPVPSGAFVNPAGEDVRAGTTLVPAGRRLGAAEMGMLAMLGQGAVLAYPRLRVNVVATGSTLVEPGRPAAFGQLRDANSYALVGALRDLGAVPFRIPIVQDVEADLRETVLSNLSRADGFVVSGGLTEAEGSDQLATLLAGIGDVDTYRTSLHPGGTFGFGLLDGVPIFDLPPDPVAALLSFEFFGRPLFMQMMGRGDAPRPELRAVLDGEVSGPAGRTLVAPARLEHRQGRWHAVPTGQPSPHLLWPVVRANGLVVIPAGEAAVAGGREVRVQVLRPLDR
jgi:molybdopterin biosynthesis enzyme